MRDTYSISPVEHSEKINKLIIMVLLFIIYIHVFILSQITKKVKLQILKIKNSHLSYLKKDKIIFIEKQIVEYPVIVRKNGKFSKSFIEMKKLLVDEIGRSIIYDLSATN